MRILHLCLACFYIDDYGYQENIMPRINKEDGHEVKIIASTETYINNKTLGFVKPRRYTTEFGVEIVRIPYKRIINKRISSKLRFYKNLDLEISLFKPDIIMSHDLSFGSLDVVLKYLKNHKNVKFFADTHTSSFNSGKNWFSLNILHRFFYRNVIRKAIPFLDRYFYITIHEKLFSIKNYGFPEEKMEFLPLGGMVLNDNDYFSLRNKTRKEYGIKDDDYLLVHTGKINSSKRTAELIQAFSSIASDRLKLFIIGNIVSNEEQILEMINADKRIVYFGWKKPEELNSFLCSADLYCQPGSESSTMENAVCCRCPVMVKVGSSYSEGEDYGNLIWVDSLEDIKSVIRKIVDGGINLKKMSALSKQCADDLLDYRKISSRIYK